MRRLLVAKMTIIPKLINAIPMKMLAGFFGGRGIEIDKLILKFMWKCKGRRIAKTALKKEEQSWRSNAV